jgi:hypothetical protein
MQRLRAVACGSATADAINVSKLCFHRSIFASEMCRESTSRESVGFEFPDPVDRHSDSTGLWGGVFGVGCSCGCCGLLPSTTQRTATGADTPLALLLSNDRNVDDANKSVNGVSSIEATVRCWIARTSVT